MFIETNTLFCVYYSLVDTYTLQINISLLHNLKPALTQVTFLQCRAFILLCPYRRTYPSISYYYLKHKVKEARKQNVFGDLFGEQKLVVESKHNVDDETAKARKYSWAASHIAD